MIHGAENLALKAARPVSPQSSKRTRTTVMLSQPRPGELVKQLTNHRTTEPPVRQKAQDWCNTVNGPNIKQRKKQWKEQRNNINRTADWLAHCCFGAKRKHFNRWNLFLGNKLSLSRGQDPAEELGNITPLLRCRCRTSPLRWRACTARIQQPHPSIKDPPEKAFVNAMLPYIGALSQQWGLI